MTDAPSTLRAESAPSAYRAESAPSAQRIMEVVSLAQATLDRLREQDGQIIGTDDELRAALAWESVGIDAILSRIGRAILDRGTMLDAADARMADLKQRKDRFARQMDAYRDLLLQALQAVGLRSFRDAEFTVSVRDGKPRLHIIDAAALPPAMVAAQTTLVPDKAAIRAALDRGEIIQGAELGNAVPQILSIRSR